VMVAPSGHACRVCREVVADGVDSELGEDVCAECYRRLEWAKAWLSRVNVMGCTRWRDFKAS
jgi:hypothetical protein